jgi:hypothetical protein
MGPTSTRATLLVLQAFVAITAVAGAAIVVPTLPLEWLKVGPLTDYTIPALALGVLCGGSAIVAFVLLVVDPRLGGAASMVAGTFMITFEIVEIAVVGLSLLEYGVDNLQSWLQIVYLVVGASGVALGYHLWTLLRHPRPMAHPAGPAHPAH